MPSTVKAVFGSVFSMVQLEYVKGEVKYDFPIEHDFWHCVRDMILSFRLKFVQTIRNKSSTLTLVMLFVQYMSFQITRDSYLLKNQFYKLY